MNDDFNERRAGDMETAILETIEALTFALGGPIESWRAKVLDGALQRLLTLKEEIGDARDADARAAALDGP